MIKKLMIILSLIGLLDSLYLTWIKLSNNVIMCTGLGGCDVVNTSEYASFAGIPIALFGVLAYIVFLFLLLYENRSEWIFENGPIILFGLSMIGFLYSLYLTYVEVFVIFAICPYCVVSAIMMTLIFVLSWFRLRISWSLA